MFRRPKAIGPIKSQNNLQSIINKLARKCHITNKTVLKMLLIYETWLGPNSINLFDIMYIKLCKTVKNLTLRRNTNKYINYAKNSFIYYHKVGTLKTVFRRPKAIGPINSPNHL